jgi:hypothetical protein
MRYLLIIIIMLLFNFGYSQTNALRKKDNLCSVIFGSTYELPFEKVIKNRFTPISADIDSAENLLKKESVKKYAFNTYIRQYVGYIDTNNNKIIIINLLKNLGTNENQQYYEDWKKEFIVGFGEVYEKNTVVKKVNLSKGNIVDGY